MKFSRITAVATVSSALVLAACSGDTTDPAGESSSAAVTDESAAASATPAATDDDAATSTVEMTTDADAGAVSLDTAEEVATEVLTQRVRADQGDGEDIEEAQKASLRGTALGAHRAADRLEGVDGEPAEVDLEENPVEPTVLAISRDDEETPVYLLVQTVPEEGAPWLHLLAGNGEPDDFRIRWEAQMLPGTEIPAFDARSAGSPVLRSGSGDLTMEPDEMLKSVGAYTEWPQPDEVPDYRTHGYAPAVRDAAEQQSEALAGQATLREKNWLVSDDVTTLMFEDGTGFVMGSLLRDTQFIVDSGSQLTPPDSFRVFQDSEVLTSEATLRTRAFIAMRVPTEDVDFKPEMLAATEQLVDAYGE
ncbi:hypothetical protein [Serinicoccus kebangsaanensis]|uniref:hypothetical protein n=1 Tax=Serinicoccus kebangsaanensis TaxID=2602069 RepID=UPI00124C41A2|nr:hypothetical protein [Serinicoccus kebangsaanensis]